MAGEADLPGKGAGMSRWNDATPAERFLAKDCVHPDHLEPVTNRENILRGKAVSARNARKTHCIHGHPFDEANTYIYPNGHRRCRRCDAQQHQDAKARTRYGVVSQS